MLLGWLSLVAGLLLTITPTLVVIRRSGNRRVPLSGPRAGSPPRWAFALSLVVGVPLLILGARGVAGSTESWPYALGAVGLAALIQLALLMQHNRRAETP
jgi:hypothetical protein